MTDEEYVDRLMDEMTKAIQVASLDPETGVAALRMRLICDVCVSLMGFMLSASEVTSSPAKTRAVIEQFGTALHKAISASKRLGVPPNIDVLRKRDMQ